MRSTNEATPSSTPHDRLTEAYQAEKPRFLARLLRAGQGLEEAEDLLHDVYVETMERLPLVSGIRNLPAWLTTLITRRLIDLWRHNRVRHDAGERDVAEETLAEIIAEAGWNPLDAFIRASTVEALDDAMKALPRDQRAVLEAQVFDGLTFREISEATGIGIDTLTARKRYALRSLARALNQWIDD